LLKSITTKYTKVYAKVTKIFSLSSPPGRGKGWVLNCVNIVL